jgi:hypothetical protein
MRSFTHSTRQWYQTAPTTVSTRSGHRGPAPVGAQRPEQGGAEPLGRGKVERRRGPPFVESAGPVEQGRGEEVLLR